MLIPVVPENVAFFEAIASEVRLKIIQLLAQEELSIKELAERLGISSPIVLKHVRKLEDAGLVATRMVKRNGSICRLCTVVFAEYLLELPPHLRESCTIYETYIPVGHYADVRGTPTCGVATEHGMIGRKDDPRAFFLPERVNAQLLWFSQGYVEYFIPNFLTAEQQATEIEISFEICSEAPDFRDDWPSDITFFFNGVRLCTWTSPGDFGLKRGIYTPEWWTSNQYGHMKVLRITPQGTLLDNEPVSDVTLEHVLQPEDLRWCLRFEVEADARHVGGLTLFGKNFGNYNRDILVRTFYVKKSAPA